MLIYENIKTVASQHANGVGCFNIFTNKSEKKKFAKTGIRIVIKILLQIDHLQGKQGIQLYDQSHL